MLHSRLTSIGFDIEEGQIFTSLVAARDLLQNEKLKPHFLLEDVALEDFHNVLAETSDFKGNH